MNWLLRKCRVRTDIEEDRRQILALTEQEFVRPLFGEQFLQVLAVIGRGKNAGVR